MEPITSIVMALALGAAAGLKPLILERDGVRFGFLQRTSVYWLHGHEATANFPGVATIKAHTAYRPQIEQLRTLTRPGMPPEIVTWADPAALAQFREDMAALHSRIDVVIASHHWGSGSRGTRLPGGDCPHGD